MPRQQSPRAAVTYCLHETQHFCSLFCSPSVHVTNQASALLRYLGIVPDVAPCSTRQNQKVW